MGITLASKRKEHFMKPFTAQITHVYHSGFIVETINHTLIFDYIEPDKSLDVTGFNRHDVFRKWISDRNNVFVFVSHHHQDHYMPSVLDWQAANPSLHLVAGYDVPVQPSKNCHLMNPCEKLKINEVSIETFGSTDDGVSFYVQADNMSFFHSGDLNWWHWNEFSPQQLEKEELDFKKEIQPLCAKSIDVAFVPVDPRLEEHYYLAGEHFVETCKPSLMVPMHFGTNFDVTKMFSSKLTNSSSSIAVLENCGQQLHYEKK